MNKPRPILLVLTAVAALSVAYPAKANTITTFNVSGTCTPVAPLTGTTFAGTLTIDVTAGTVTAIDVTFQGLSPFYAINLSFPFPPTSSWILVARNGGGLVNELFLDFTTGHTPPSLVGFTGGTILPGTNVVTLPSTLVYDITGGSITAPASVPDAGSTVSLLGFASLGLVALRRKLSR
jgi:hypothetical protein